LSRARKRRRQDEKKPRISPPAKALDLNARMLNIGDSLVALYITFWSVKRNFI